MIRANNSAEFCYRDYVQTEGHLRLFEQSDKCSNRMCISKTSYSVPGLFEHAMAINSRSNGRTPAFVRTEGHPRLFKQTINNRSNRIMNYFMAN